MVEVVVQVERRDLEEEHRDFVDRDLADKDCFDRDCFDRDLIDRDCKRNRGLGLGTPTSCCWVHHVPSCQAQGHHDPNCPLIQ